MPIKRGRGLLDRGAPISIRLRLVLFTVALLLPALLITVLALEQGYQRERAAFEEGLRGTARAAALALDRQIEQSRVVLETLATSDYLTAGDLQSFDRQAREAVRGADRWVVLLDARDDQQLLNTRAPWGTALPRTPWRDAAAGPASEGQIDVSDLFYGAVAQQPVFFVNLHATRGGRAYDISLTLLASSLDPLLQGQQLAQGWVGAVLDRTGTVVSRTHDPARFVGAKATPDMLQAIARGNEDVIRSVSLNGIDTLAAFSRSPAYGWTFVIAAPYTDVVGAARRNIAIIGLGGIALLGLGIALAILLGRSIAAPIETLKAQAAALGRGETVRAQAGALREANAVGAAMAQASAQLARGKRELTEALRSTERQSEALRRAGAEKDVLLREVHHRVKNNLAMIAGLVRIAGRRAPADAQTVLRDISRRIVTVGQIYTQIHDADDLRRVDLAAYMQAICHNTGASLGRDAVVLETALAPCTVDIDTAVPLGLIVGELLTNAYKHAFPGERGGRIAVSLACDGPTGTVTVEDDGVGMPEIRRTGASGLGLATALAGQVDGRLEATSAPGAGARFRVTFKLASAGDGRRVY